MNNFSTKAKSFVSPQTLYSSHSEFNGDIEVVEQLGRRELVIGGLQQSGDLVARLWEKAIRKLRFPNDKLRVLILGLGAGSVVQVINKHMPNAQITGVEIDKQIVDVGKQFFGLDKYSNLTIYIQDAIDFIRKSSDSYDILLLDMYQGENIPNEVYTKDFIATIQKRIDTNGYILFNHLRGKRYDSKRQQLETLVKSEFYRVEAVQPLVNTVYICHMV